MKQHEVLSRREFIKVASTAGAALVIGISLPARRRGQAIASTPADTFAPNAWLRINKNGMITITVAKSEMGQGVLTSLPMIVAEELEADWSKVRYEHADADPKYGNMGTGGSTSVRTSWQPLRKAGAAAREMLIMAAAKRWDVKTTTCKAEEGKVIHPPSGRTLMYGDLVEDAARLELPAKVELKSPKSFRIIGKRLPRLDTPSKVDGRGLFGLDVKVPDLLYAVVARCPVFGGTVARFDAAKALSMPGVRQVVQVETGVAVVADSTWAAMQGRNALDITWSEGSNATLSSPAIQTMLEEAAKKTGVTAEQHGDVQTALTNADRTVEAVYEVPFLAHATMEPMNCTAHVREGRCEIWAPTQSAQWIQGEAAKITGLEGKDVTVHVTLLGGGFGRRAMPDFATEAVHVSKAVNAPVKLTWTREDDMQHDWYRPVSLHHLRGGLGARGNLTALWHHVVAPSIGEQMSPGSVKDGLDKSAVEGTVELPYHIPNFLVDYVMANTAVPIGWWRSVYPTQNVFALECFIDELAQAAKKDPVAFRRALLSKSPRMLKVLDTVVSHFGWKKPLPKGHHRGIACAPPAFFGSYVAQAAEVSVGTGGKVRVHRVVCGVDCGPVVNPDTIEAQMESSIVYGLTAALYGAITIDKGRVVQGNFDDYPLLTIDEMPKVEVYSIRSDQDIGGIGEPATPPIAPAVANAVSDALGRRIRQLPIRV
jgi:isoquinoline 1-oxidoreductase beta subunit